MFDMNTFEYKSIAKRAMLQIQQYSWRININYGQKIVEWVPFGM
jgi:hypothetical protein